MWSAICYGSDYRYVLTGSIDHASPFSKAGYLSDLFVPSVCPPLKLLSIFLGMPLLAAYSGRLALFTITLFKKFQEWGPVGRPATYIVVGFLIILILVSFCCMRLWDWLILIFSQQTHAMYLAIYENVFKSNPDSPKCFFFFFYQYIGFTNTLLLLWYTSPKGYHNLGTMNRHGAPKNHIILLKRDNKCRY